MPRSAPRPTLHLGVLAHVDAGKTTLTERLLHHAGVVEHPGRVDHGDTVTDADAIERRRGITIQAAVVSFPLARPDGGPPLAVNLVDTPGHSDFVAEVERALTVLDAAVLVVSAVEGVQPQTRALIRALERLQLPFLVVVNKIDRTGARGADLLPELDVALRGRPVAVTAPTAVGGRGAGSVPRDPAGLLADVADAVGDDEPEVELAFLQDRALPGPRLAAALARATARGAVHPVLWTAALAGVGTQDVVDAVATYLPARYPDADAQLHARVFKVGRDHRGRRRVHVRLDAGRLAPRDRVPLVRHDAWGGATAEEVLLTGVGVVEGPGVIERPAAAGEIAVLGGLMAAVGDELGTPDAARTAHRFPPPQLEAVVRALDPARRTDLHQALALLAEQDPLIDVRLVDAEQELVVSLYGEVQREVIAARLVEEHGIEVEVLPTRVVHVERLAGVGEARRDTSSGNAQVGLRLEPGRPGAGPSYALGDGVERGYLLPSFHTAIETTIARQLHHGLHGWQVADAVVTLVHGRFTAVTPPAGEFRRLTAEAFRAALTQAGTVLCAPRSRVELSMPATALTAALAMLGERGGIPGPVTVDGDRAVLVGHLATAEVDAVERRVPDLTSGLGTFLAEPDGYVPIDPTAAP